MLAEGLKAQSIRYRYWNKVHNLGDAITAPVVKSVLGFEPVFANKRTPHVLGIGSIFALANEHSVVWGSGIMDPGHPLPHVGLADIRAVRGYESLRVLKKWGALKRDVPVGDPGVLVRDLVRPTEERSGRIAVIPHHSSMELPAFRDSAPSGEIDLLDFRTQSLTVLETIAQADAVISESLHGLIFAEALGRPSVWISTKDDAYWNFKYLDWYSTTEAKTGYPIRIKAEAADWSAIAKSAERSSIAFSREDLLNAFPADQARPTTPNLVPYEVCREASPVVIEPPSPLVLDDKAGATISSSADLIGLLGEQTIGDLQRHATKRMAGYSEPTFYVLGLSGATVPARDNLEKLQSVMNKFSSFDAMFVHPGQPPSGAVTREFMGLAVAFEGNLLDTLMIRPGRSANGLSKIGTVYLNLA